MGRDEEENFTPKPVKPKIKTDKLNEVIQNANAPASIYEKNEAANKQDIVEMVRKEVHANMSEVNVLAQCLNKVFEEYTKDDSKLTYFELSVNFAEKRFSKKNNNLSKADLAERQEKHAKLLNELRDENKELKRQLAELRSEFDAKFKSRTSNLSTQQSRQNCCIM